MKTAVIFHRLGPYHFSRLRAAGGVLPVVAIETSGADETYAWEKITGADGFERVTLFENADAQKQPAREVAQRLSAALDHIQPQVIFVPGWADSAALATLRWCGQNRVPAVIMSESTEWDEPRKAWKEFIKRQIVRLGSAALAGGTAHRDYLAQLDMPLERIFLGYDAVDNRYFADKVAEVRSQNTSSVLRPPSPQSGEGRLPEKYFLASARFVEKKNLPRLIRAYARYRDLAGNAEKLKIGNTSPRPSPQSGEGEALWDLVLLGDGPLRETLDSQLSTLNLHTCVLLPGFIQYPELPAYYASAGAFIHASTSEQWGLVVNEAMASGLPVLVSNRCGCAADLVQEGVNGFTFDPYNVEQLAQLMLKISDIDFSSPPRPGRGIQGEVSSPASGSAICHPPSLTLAQIGAASRRIISEWGPERFAQGLKAAAEKALAVGPKRASLLQQMILKALLAR